MRRKILAFLVAALVATSCGASNASVPGADEVGQIIAAAFHQLATVDTTFGEGFRFQELLVLDRTDPGAGTGSEVSSSVDVYGPAIRAAVEQRLEGVTPMRWISDADRWRNERLEPMVEGSAILGAGRVTFDGDVALVPVSMWCGGTCGLWQTYRIESISGAWTVTGVEGPVAMS